MDYYEASLLAVIFAAHTRGPRVRVTPLTDRHAMLKFAYQLGCSSLLNSSKNDW